MSTQSAAAAVHWRTSLGYPRSSSIRRPVAPPPQVRRQLRRSFSAAVMSSSPLLDDDDEQVSSLCRSLIVVAAVESAPQSAQMSQYGIAGGVAGASFAAVRVGVGGQQRKLNRVVHATYSQSIKELVAGSPQQRNWRGIATALLVIVLMCGAIAIAVLILTPLPRTESYSGTPISFAEMLINNISGGYGGASWISGDRLVYRDEVNQSLMLIQLRDGQVQLTELIDDQPFQHFGMQSAVPSSDLQWIATSYHSQRLFKHSTSASYKLFHIPSNGRDTVWVSPGGVQMANLRYFTWNPIADTDDFIFVYENNVWYQASPTSGPFPITTTGQEFVYNGVPDWLYEEEILSTPAAIWWSHTGDQIAFASFDDRKVKKMRFPYYGTEMYPNDTVVPYPKASKRWSIPKVSLTIWDKLRNQSFPVRAPQVVTDGEHYLLFANWLKTSANADELLLAIWANRLQNVAYYTICTKTKPTCILNYKQEFRKVSIKMWAEPEDFKLRHSAPGYYFAIVPEMRGDNVYNHIANISIPADLSSGRAVILRAGDYDVVEIVGYNAARDQVLFVAAAPEPRLRNLYRVGRRGGGGAPVCVTCELRAADDCASYSVAAAADADHYLLFCVGPGRPRTWLRRVSEPDFELLVVNNSRLAEYADSKALPTVVYERVPIDGDYDAIVRLMFPPGVNPHEPDRMYPVVLHVYGGPGSQEVTARTFPMGFDAYLASTRRYVVVSADTRGSGFRGWKYKAPIYRHMGDVEIADQIAVVKHLLRKYPFLDQRYVAVWGWSYGGFAAARIVEEDIYPRTFNCAASVAPVTDFQYYDAAYTERYMGFKEDNADGYKKTNVMRGNLEAFKKVKYFIAHGTGDDNVHFQHSAMLIRELTLRNIQFRMMIYPNDQHSINGGRRHLYTELDNFLLNCFDNAAGADLSG